jgi:integrase
MGKGPGSVYEIGGGRHRGVLILKDEFGLPFRKEFTGKDPIKPDILTDAIKQMAKDAGVSVPYIGPHAFRRTYGMTLLEAGVDIVTAAELMRHDPMVLAKEYAQTRKDLKTDAVKRAFGGDDAPPDVARERRG